MVVKLAQGKRVSRERKKAIHTPLPFPSAGSFEGGVGEGRSFHSERLTYTPQVMLVQHTGHIRSTSKSPAEMQWAASVHTCSQCFFITL